MTVTIPAQELGPSMFLPPAELDKAAAAAQARALTAAFDPNQPRDEHGKFTETGGGFISGPLTETPEWLTTNVREPTDEQREAAKREMQTVVDELATRGDPAFADRLTQTWEALQAKQALAEAHGPSTSTYRESELFKNALVDSVVAAYIPVPEGWKPVVTPEEADKIDGGLGRIYHATMAGGSIEREGFVLPETQQNADHYGRGVYWVKEPDEDLTRRFGIPLELVSYSTPDERASLTLGDGARDNYWFNLLRATTDLGSVYTAANQVAAVERGKTWVGYNEIGMTFHPRLLSVVKS